MHAYVGYLFIYLSLMRDNACILGRPVSAYGSRRQLAAILTNLENVSRMQTCTAAEDIWHVFVSTLILQQPPKQLT